MGKNKRKEELQSRREFFKKAAKGALPILGALLLSGTPSILKAIEKEPMGCKFGCSGTCYSSCLGGCRVGCEGCSGTCRGTCTGSCVGTCEINCKGTCKGTSSKY